jgi:CMP-N,N'-diacetyllegionaminic acid synthase
MRVLGLIPARGGSKGVPHKNIRSLCGKPLLQYTAQSAKASSRLTQVILSTEDDEIAEVGRYCGLDVPFMRPVELAEDETPMLPVVQHALMWFEKRGERFDAVCLLQPTNPLRTTAMIDGCLELFAKNEPDAVVTILPVPAEYNPHWVYYKDQDGSLQLSTGEAMPISRRQDLPQAFHREGSVYVVRRNVVIDENSLYGRRVLGFPVLAEHSVNIDNLKDWQRAEQLLLARST